MKEKDYYSIKAVSSTGLRYLKTSPKTYNGFMNNTLHEEEKHCLTFGRLFHLFVLEPKIFNESVTVMNCNKPASKQQESFCTMIANGISRKDAYSNSYSVKDKSLGVIDTESAKLYILYKEYIELIKSDKQIISKEDYECIEKMRDSFMCHKAISKLLERQSIKGKVDVMNEFAIMFHINDTDCKALIDKLIVDYENKIIIIVDVKHTSHLLKDFIETFVEFGYDIQLAFYTRAVMYYLEECGVDISEFKIKWLIPVVEKGRLYESKLFTINSSVIESAAIEISSLLYRLSKHEKYGFDYSVEYYEGDGVEVLM